jgi:hypothetical protein
MIRFDRIERAACPRGPLRASDGRGAAREPAPRAGRGQSPDIGQVPLVAAGGAQTMGYPAQRRIALRDSAPTPDRSFAPTTSRPLPGPLRDRVERQSGLPMDHVRVHHNSREPERLHALAFARGGDIHLAPGQDSHLPHEAWHLAQQAQGRVRPTLRVDGVGVNDSAELEREAEAFGAGRAVAASPAGPAIEDPPAQRVVEITDGALQGSYSKPTAKITNDLIAKVQAQAGTDLALGWKGSIRSWVAESDEWTFTTAEFLDEMKSSFEKEDKGEKSKIRPNFPASSYRLAKISYGLQTGQDESDISLSDEDLAMPHRFPYAAIQQSTGLFIAGKEDEGALDRWSDRLIAATTERRDINHPLIKKKADADFYKKTIDDQLHNIEAARTALKQSKAKGDSLTLSSPVVQQFLKWANAMHGNIPDLGPHSTINIQVSDRLHMHTSDRGRPAKRTNVGTSKRSLTPGSRRALDQSPERLSRGLAYDNPGKMIITTDGLKLDPSELEADDVKRVKRHRVSSTTIK